MELIILIISIFIIIIVLLQSNKATDGGQIITGGNSELFKNQKERGSELFITRLTGILGALFIIISLILYLNS